MGLNMTPLTLIPALLLYPWEEIEEDLAQKQALTDYMREGERAQVQWVGNPIGFGFGGEPSQDGAMMMFEGLAGNGERLARQAREVGIDFTFSIGKDLSILYVLGDDQLREKIDRARTRAIDQTMALVERDYMRVRRGSGKDEANRVAERAAAWVGIRYSHSSNREGEPLLHDHVHVSTLVQNRDGGFQRLWSRALFARGGAVLEALGHRHEAELREAISAEIPSIRWGEVGENGTALVEQVPEMLRDALSTRTRKRIDPVVAEWESANRMPATSAVRQMIALQTRQKKELAGVMTREQVETVALQHGLDEMTMLREIVAAPPAKARAVASVKEIADMLVSGDGLTQMTTAFRLPAVQLAVSRAGVPASQIDAYVEQIVDDLRVIKIETAKEVKWTTVELVEKEQSLISLLTSAERETRAPVVDATVVERVIADHGATPNVGQLAAVKAFTGSSAGTVLIEANAGTGKTYVAGLANKIWERDGIPVLGAAPTGKAVTELKAAGVERSRTFASLANHVNQNKPLVELTGGVPGILLGDELTMVHTREAEFVLRAAVSEGFAVRGMGHSAQLQSVQAGGWFKQVTEQHQDELGEALVRLDEVIRQKSTDEGKALNDVAARAPHKWVAYQEKHGRLRGYGLSPRERHQATMDAVSMWLEREGQDVLLISATNQLRQDLNMLAQTQLQSTGRLTGEQVGFQTSEGETIHAGEKLILKRNDRGLGVDNGTRATAVAGRGDGLVIQIADREVLLPAEYIAEHVRLGYAVTIHDSQGATADHTIVVTPVKNLDSELAYVAASRARHTTTMLVLTDPDPGWKGLKSRLRLEGAEQTASKHIETMRSEHVQGSTRNTQAEVSIVPPRKANAPATPTRRPVSKEPDGRPNGTTRSPASRAKLAPWQWPVSKHRAALSALHSRLEEAKETHAQVMQDAIEKAALVRDLDEQIQQIKTAALDDARGSKRRHRKDLEARQAIRQEQVNRLSVRRAQLPTPPDTQTLSAEFVTYQQQHQDRRNAIIKDAAVDEIEIGTPVFEQTLGPRPDSGQARDVWDRAALAIGKHRVERGITHPYQHGVDTGDWRSRKLGRDLDRLIERLNRHWTSQGLQLKIAPLRGAGQDPHRGMGME